MFDAMFYQQGEKRLARVVSEGQCDGVCGEKDLPTTVQLCSSPLCTDSCTLLHV